MGGFVDPFVPESAWPQDTMFIGSSWPAAGPAGTYLGGAGAAAPDQLHLQNVSSSSSTGALLNGSAKEIVSLSPVEELHEQFLSAHLPLPADDVAPQGLNFEVDSVVLSTPCAISLADSAPVVCCSSNDSSGSEQSGLPPFLLLGVGEQQPAWAPSTFPRISSLVGEETSQSCFGFSNHLLREASCAADAKKYPQLGDLPSAPLQLHVSDQITRSIQ